MTTLETVLAVCLVILLVQYLGVIYAFFQKETAIGLAISTMEGQQKYINELFKKLLTEEKLTHALASRIKDMQHDKSKIDLGDVSGMQ